MTEPHASWSSVYVAFDFLICSLVYLFRDEKKGTCSEQDGGETLMVTLSMRGRKSKGRWIKVEGRVKEDGYEDGGGRRCREEEEALRKKRKCEIEMGYQRDGRKGL